MSVRLCATAATARGTVTAVVVDVAHSEYVEVYRREGARAVLVLRGPTTDPMTQVIGVAAVDPERDGQTKVVVVYGTPFTAGHGTTDGTVDSYDLVDPPGVVSLHRTLLAGAVRVAPGGGLTNWQEAEGARLMEQTVRHRAGRWVVTASEADVPLPTGLPDGVSTPAP